MILRPFVILAVVTDLIVASAAVAAPKPAPPPPFPREAEVLDIADCDNPGQAQAIAASAVQRIQRAMEGLAAGDRYAEDLMRWKSQRLLESKAWTTDDARAFLRDLSASEGFRQFLETSPQNLEHVSSLVQAVDDARASGDDTAICRAAVPALEATLELTTLSAEQWALIHARLDAVAKAKGVRFD